MLIQFCLTFHVLYSFLVHVKHLINVTNPKVQRKSFTATQNIAPELPAMPRLQTAVQCESKDQW